MAIAQAAASTGAPSRSSSLETDLLEATITTGLVDGSGDTWINSDSLPEALYTSYTLYVYIIYICVCVCARVCMYTQYMF